MRIEKLYIQQFRNLHDVTVQADDARVVCLFGANGAGKTNLLESLSLLSPGRGLHRAARQEQLPHGTDNWAFHTHADTHSGTHTIGMAYTRNRTRSLKINGSGNSAQEDLSAIGNVLWFTPAMDRLFHDGAQARRQFLDRMVYGLLPGHAAALNKLRHHLRCRLTLLKQNAQADWLALEEEQAAAAAAHVLENRHLFLEKLQPHLPEVTLNLHGKADDLLSHSNLPAALAEEMARRRERDRLSGTTTFGVQRSDLGGTLNTVNCALQHTSTGQHKRALLHILLANARLMRSEKGTPALLLLDEITAHLDKTTRAALFNDFVELGTQLWLTGTEKELFDGLPHPLLIEVKEGTFTAA